ncbi:MAG: putative ABC exporter domain-containing protein [Lachnospiraceae bacterium]|nr:putative ABC exporter domain-containing protein [Lachnospiraceae bacterium]
MRLFGYYIAHSFWNQIRKLLRSWVIIFILICALVGGIIGFSAGMIAEHSEETKVESQVDSEETDSEKDLQSGFNPLEASGLDPMGLAELIFALSILGFAMYEVATAESGGGSIFLPADVTLLFPSPLRPQSVLLFRLATRMGLFVFFTIYMICANGYMLQGIDTGKGVKAFIVVTWLLTYFTSKLLQMLVYLDISMKDSLKKRLRGIVLGLSVALFAFYYVSWTQSGVKPGIAANQILNAKYTNFIPLYGWLKGIAISALHENYLAAGIYAGLSLLAIVGLFVLVYMKKADFYEPAMAKSEEIAERLEKAKESRNGLGRKGRKSDEKTESRMGLKHGWGASIYFWKPMHERMIGKGYGILTKTSLTYLVFSVMAGFLGDMMWGINGGITSLVLLGVFVFYRSMGNPLMQDTGTSYFVMVPESTWLKLFYSLLSGTVNCIFDLLPSLIVLAVLYRPSVYIFLCGILILLSLDYYATVVSVFIDSAISESISKVVKQMVQIVFIYVGLLPDIILLVVGYVTDSILDILPYMAILNCSVGVILYALTPLVIDPMGVKASKPSREEAVGNVNQAKKDFTWIGCGAIVMILGTILAQIGVSLLADHICPEVLNTSYGTWLLTFLPEYLIAFPIGVFLICRVKNRGLSKAKEAPLGYGNTLKAIPALAFMLLSGSLVGGGLNLLFRKLLGKGGGNPVVSLIADDSILLRVIFMAVLAPIIEEFIFRKVLIDRLRPYGDLVAVVTSALIFGLIHGNLSQMFYAFGIGLVLGLIYLETGRLRYTIPFHMGINLLGAVIMPELLKQIDMKSIYAGKVSLPLIILVIYLVLYYVLAMIGFVVICITAVRHRYIRREMELPRFGAITVVWGNPGMLLFLVTVLGVIIYSVVG